LPGFRRVLIAAMTKAVPGAVGSRAALLLRDVLRNQSRASPAAVARVARLLEQVGGGRHGGDVSTGLGRRPQRRGCRCSWRSSYPVRTATAGGTGGTVRFRAVMPASMALTTDSATFTLAHRLSSASTSTHGAAA
jgi:hypothetical protein